jgi:chromosome segregation ATPase
MSTTMEMEMETEMEAQTIVSADEFQALEQKVSRAIEVVRREREARAAAESEAAALREQLESLTRHSNAAQAQITTLNQERDTVRTRVEKMLDQMEEMM